MISHLKHSLSQLTSLRIKQPTYLLLALLTISACSEKPAEQKNANNYHQSASLLTISPEQSYTVERNYLGQVTAKQHTNLSFEYAGKIIEIFVDNGDRVKKGQLLAQQDTQLLNYKTSELQAQITQFQAQSSLNKANLNRIKTLISDGYSSKQRLDELDAENKILNAKIMALNARIKTIQYQRDKSALVAPFDGVVTKRFISNGEIITSSKTGFRIIESANNEINVGIPSTVASSLVLGQIIQIKVDEQNKQAKLISIGHQIDPVNRTVQLRLKMLEKLDNDKSFNGQLVRIIIDKKINKSGFWIPTNAITDGVRGQWQIFIASKLTDSINNYQLQAATVNVLYTNEHSVYVNGLASKEFQIIAQGVHRYVAGQIITTSTKILANTEGSH